MADLIEFGDVASAMPSCDPTVIQDLNALIAVQVPCLAEADPKVRAAAKALIRQHLRSSTHSQGARRVTRTQGPFSYTLDFGDGAGTELLGDSLLRQLRALCDPRAGSRMTLVDVHSLPQSPAPYGYETDGETVSLPVLRWWD